MSSHETGHALDPAVAAQARKVLEVEDGELHDEAALERALASVPPPRSPELLLDKLRGLNVTPEDVVVDLGCGHGQYSVQIASATRCRVFAMDLSGDRAAETLSISKDARADRVDAARAIAEALPLREGSVRVIWSRDMLSLVVLPAALPECARVVTPGGHVLVYQTFATELLEPLEAQRLYGSAGSAENMDPKYFEGCARDAGFTIVERDEIRGEWREWWETEGSRKTSLSLMRASQWVRGGDALRERVGDKAYEFGLADQLWGIYQMIGKLCPTVYVLRRD